MVGRERIRKFAGLGAALLTMVGAITLATRVEVAPVGERSPAELWSREAGGEHARGAFSSLPLAFVENRGQTDGQVRYVAHGARFGFFLTPESLVMSLLQPDGERGVNLSLDFVDANPDVVVESRQRAPGTVSYLRGNDSSRWLRELSSFAEVVYRELWPGVDLALRGDGGVLKYEFRVRPGARIGDIRLAYRGADRLVPDGSGALLVETASGALRDAPPVSYQVIGGKRVAVDSDYQLDLARDGELSYGFAVGDYDTARELIIDPGLEYSTFLGGFGNQAGAAIEVDSSGNAYVTGFTQSPTFPTTPGAFDRTGSVRNDLDAFVSKLNATGTGLVYSTFLGGSNFEWGRDLAIDAAGNAYVAGQTKSSSFPTTSGAFDRSFNIANCPRCGIDQYDAFVTKLNPTGSGLVYSTFLGGTDIDDIRAIAIDGAGRAHVAGETTSQSFPTRAGSFDTTPNGGVDAFVAKFNATGSGLDYSTRLGGTDNETADGIDVDASGNVVVGGATRSANFPSTPGALQPTHSGGDFIDLFEGYVTKLNPTGSALVYSTFLGGTKRDSVGNVILDALGNTYLSGGTESPEFPTTPGAFDTAFDNPGVMFASESFVAKLNPTGSAFVYSTFLGEAGASVGAVEADGSVWLAGGSGSPDAFVSPDAWAPQLNGGSDAYIAKLNPTGSAFDYATFFGGTQSDGAVDLALDPDGDVYVVGTTRSPDFPTTEGAIDREYSADPFINGSDMWVAKFAVGPDAPPPPHPHPRPLPRHPAHPHSSAPRMAPPSASP